MRTAHTELDQVGSLTDADFQHPLTVEAREIEIAVHPILNRIAVRFDVREVVDALLVPRQLAAGVRVPLKHRLATSVFVYRHDLFPCRIS